MKRTSLPLQRREFITLLGGAAAAWPLAARAQQASKCPVIGVLGEVESRRVTRICDQPPFGRVCSELGYDEGQNVRDRSIAGQSGNTDRLSGAGGRARSRRNVDVIVTTWDAARALCGEGTQGSTIPIVFAGVGDPVGTGVIGSLARPGGNATGLSLQQPDLAGKRLGLMRQVLPNLARLAIMGNVAAPSVVIEMREVQEAARALALNVAMLEIKRDEDVALGFDKTQAAHTGPLCRNPPPNSQPKHHQ